MLWFLAVLRQYATFRGRARRREFWTFFLVNVAIYALLIIVDGLTGTFDMGTERGLLGTLYLIATLVPWVAVAVRRLHDTDRSGWWALLIPVPVVQIVLLYFLIQEGDEGGNDYGLDPRAAPGQGA
ncbi:MAG: hypothetical protein RLZZ200_1853 [Pseudomonadota bacterium]